MEEEMQSKQHMVCIQVHDEQSLQQGAEAVAQMLEEIERSIAKRRQIVCSCGRTEWADPGETICWKCQRLAQGLAVVEWALCPVCNKEGHIKLLAPVMCQACCSEKGEPFLPVDEENDVDPGEDRA
jgi:hypothetical protein